MSALRRTPLHRALYRPNLILGGERELVLITAIICSGVAVSGLNLVSAGVGLTVWLIAIGLMQMMAKADPDMSKIYLRQLQYGAYYPARSKTAPSRAKGVSDLLTWATLMADGVVINKDGFKTETPCFNVSGKYFDKITAMEKAQHLSAD
jgi:type IV secretion system protein VirB3